MTITLELSEDEAVALHQLIDAAVRSLGLQGALAGVTINQKLVAATKAAKETVTKEPGQDGA